MSFLQEHESPDTDVSAFQDLAGHVVGLSQLFFS